MKSYLIYSGILLNAILIFTAFLFAWVMFIWPAVESVSITRCQWKVAKKHGNNPTVKDILKTYKYWYSDLIFGRSWDRISNRQFEWEGVGNWKVYDVED